MHLQQVFQQSVAQMQRGDFARARELLKPLLKKVPGNADGWQLLAACEKNLGNADAALKAFKKSLKLEPKQPHTWNNLGNLHLQRNEVQDAVRCYRRALDFNPAYDDARLNLAHALVRRGRFADALAEYETLEKRHPANGNILVWKADCHRQLKRPETAVDILKRALQLSTDAFTAHFKLGLAYKAQANWEEAQREFETCISQQPRSIAALSNLASVAAAQGKHGEAINLYRRCIELEPLNPEHHKWLNKLLWMCGEPDFLESYDLLAERIFDSPSLLAEKSRFLRLTGNEQKAAPALEEAIRRGGTNPQLVIELAAAYREMGRIADAIQLLDKLAKRMPSTPLVQDALGRALLQAGEFTRSSKLYRRLTNEHPLNQGYWCMYSTALQMEGNPLADALLDYSNLVRVAEIRCPAGFASLREFNEALAEHLQELHNTKREPVDQSLSGGTQTLNNLFDSREPIIQQLVAAFREVIGEHLAGLQPVGGHPFLGRIQNDVAFSGSWSVNLKTGGRHRSHFHTEGWISSAYYVSVPPDVEQGGEGWIEFGRPEFPVPGKDCADYIVKPGEGSLVLFPSYMWHGTRPFLSSERRMTVAFDAIPG